jgi:hypothetical protein
MDYNKLKVDQLKKECDKREIVCKETREEMIKVLKLYDEDKWIFHTLQKKLKHGGYHVQIDIRNTKELIEMGKLVEKKLATNLKIYATKRLYFRTENEFIVLS